MELLALDLQPHLGEPTGENNCPNENSNCVPYYLCSNGSINTNGEGLIDIRKDEGPCTDYMQICCEKKDQTSQPLTTTPPPVPPPKGCGYRRPNGVGFKITGAKNNESQFGEFPWMAAVFRDIGFPSIPDEYRCGGALIHPQVVITAAHCVSNKNISFKIRVGEWDSVRPNVLYPYQNKKVYSVKIHPQYYSGALYNDIAFLYLESPVTINEHVDVICLPPQEVVTDERCYSTGWGKDQFGKEGVYQVILKKIDLPLVPKDVCQEKLRQTRLGKDFELHRSFMCAGGEKGKDTCKGDGGSPLVCPIKGEEDRYYHAGIVAWGIGCGENDIPGVYTDVAMFREWIDEQMKFNGLDNEIDTSILM
ncbi:hypothetical protein NQ314_007645 [Rhamnusium bicolor]|uniref:Phenoloxidase-activating factor 2 n=1 Tax=Rhamnusium bicolor TaxID=1586634 RepID=A0AAV8YJU0_9CUCU|nr:hypothetical protein NQ314_007645 [Rhamnusium bicolor]